MEPASMTVTFPTTPVKWGRQSNANWGHTFGALTVVIASPFVILLNWVALEHHGGSLWAAMIAAYAEPLGFLHRHMPWPSAQETEMYLSWLLLQAVLYTFLPGPSCSGQRTPGGCLLTYTANGLAAWTLTHLLYAMAFSLKIIKPAIIANHWAGFLAAANAYGTLLAGYSQLKGYCSPTFPEDQKLSGSWVFDFFAGVELNPKIGPLDVKFFHNGRPGIVAWTLIDLSWAAYQYEHVGYVTDSMIVVLLLHTLYVVDFFYNEAWYTQTVDITHEHFGFFLAWGDTTFLPSYYTLQAQYLARYSVDVSRVHNIAILIFGLLGYAIFRTANNQRYHVRARQHDPKLTVWGAPATFIRCKYLTADGKKHGTILLTCGWWGLARHANYLGDLIMAWSMCATCGFTYVLPWSYFLFLFGLLSHRALRDERRCRNKYGRHWEQYCQSVPYWFIPGVF